MINRIKPGFWVVLAAFFVLYFFFGTTLNNLNRTFFQLHGGDGIQSYYNILFHVKHDTSYMHSTAMNYPYGENVFFTNNFHFFTNPIKWISKYVVDISPYTKGIINGSMLLSLILCAYFLYLIFRRFSIPYVLAGISAIGITFLSPQIIRMQSHYGLSYAFLVPSMILVLWDYFEQPSLRNSIKVSLYALFMGTLSFYYFGLIGFTLGIYWLYRLIVFKAYKEPLMLALHGFIQLVIPFVILQLWVKLTDEVPDRTANPWGFFHYHSNLNGVFTPLDHPFSTVLGKFIKLGRCAWEGKAFVGFLAEIFMLIALFKWFRQKWNKQNVESNHWVQLLWLIAISALLISFGLPFTIDGLEKGVEYLSFFKQLRSIGRFNWIFFYILNIMAIVGFYKWLNRLPKAWNIGLWTILFVILFQDAYFNTTRLNGLINNYDLVLEDVYNEALENQILNQVIDSVDQYQAIVSLPHFHIGSESLWLDVIHTVSLPSFEMALKTGLTLTSVMSSRTSLSQTYKNMSLFSEPYRYPKIIDEYKSKKDLLLIVNPGRLKDYEREWVKRSDSIGRWNNVDLYKMKYDSLFIGMKALYEREAAKFTGVNDSILAYHEYFTNEVEGVWGKGALELDINDDAKFIETPIYIKEDGDHTLSFWMSDVNKDLYPRTLLDLKVFDATGKQIFKFKNAFFRFFNVYDDDWVLVEIPIGNYNKGAYKIELSIENYIRGGAKIKLDEFMIRPTNKDVYQVLPKGILKNNRLYLKPQ